VDFIPDEQGRNLILNLGFLFPHYELFLPFYIINDEFFSKGLNNSEYFEEES
jgi:hypothetical protein